VGSGELEVARYVTHLDLISHAQNPPKVGIDHVVTLDILA